MKSVSQFPLYAKAALILIGLFVLFNILSIIETILLPLIFAFILAVVIVPMVNWLIKKGWGRALSSFVVLALSVLILVGLILLILSQANKLGASWPQLTAKFEMLVIEFTGFLSRHLDLSKAEIDSWFKRIQEDMLSNSGKSIGLTITNLGAFLAMTLLIPVYTFMLLYYQPHLITFIHKLFGAGYDVQVSHILTKTKTLIQRYLLGLSIEVLILAALNSLGLWIIGIDYAILLGIAGALLNIIPYLGGIIGVSIYALVALITRTPMHVLYVLALYSAIQVIDNNYIVPKIVGGKVRLNALVSIIAVIAGAALWGIPGMFLSIPFVAILKLILDNIESLQHWGTVLGEPGMKPTVSLPKMRPEKWSD